jgi:8-oxo-dGTP pyrophosphatase MutT (NUDIX family)
MAMGAHARDGRGSNDPRLNDPGSRSLVRPPVSANQRSNGIVRLAHLCKLRECEQVAAVCYRLRNGSIEFLLVRTRNSGRWTFPKGSAEPGLTHAQAAALEAFEEAGVHGRIEEASFARYICRKRGAASKRAERSSEKRSSKKGLAVHAHLCLVLRLGKPKETNRNRTWFSAEDAKKHLREGRESDGREFVQVVDRAVARIQQLHGATSIDFDKRQQGREREQGRERGRDALQKVQFEAHDEVLGRMRQGSFVPHSGPRAGEIVRYFSRGAEAKRPELLQCEVLEFSPTKENSRNSSWFPGRKKPKALGTGTKGE